PCMPLFWGMFALGRSLGSDRTELEQARGFGGARAPTARLRGRPPPQSSGTAGTCAPRPGYTRLLRLPRIPDFG
ncbi:MAG: hypothetical protein PUG31_06460, partial [Eubacteriales bacterium]|nr:hypothetical protein [Eubacteriales bacterium]